MKPGAQDNGTVQLATGTVSFPIRLFSLAGRNGLDFDLAIYYSSGGIHKIADTSNLESPTGLLGLGWALPKEAIIRNTNATGTSVDDVYYLVTGGNLYPLFKISLDEMIEGEVYECENYNFWQIRYLRNRELWTVTKENGDRYSYGGELPASADAGRSSVGNSIEWGVKWKNWIGPSDVAVGQQQFPIVWNLASIENIWNERVSFEYEQTQRLTGTVASSSRRPFTKSCRLSRVTGASGDSIVLKYTDKQPEEYQRPHNPPAATPNNVCRIIGKLTARGWESLRSLEPVLSLSLTVTDKNGFQQNFAPSDRTGELSLNVDLGPNAPNTLDIAFQAKAVDYVGVTDEFLSGSFTGVIANAGIVQTDYKLDRKRATLKLSYVKEQTATTEDADIYQRRLETKFLAGLELYSADGVKTEQAELGYQVLGGGDMQKRVLASITHSIRTKTGSLRPSSPSHMFEYYGQAQSDGVMGVLPTANTIINEDIGTYSSPTYNYKLFNESSGALYGALKAYTSPAGSKTSYRYKQHKIDQASRELNITRPQNDSPAWQGVETYFGLDYAVVIWKGSNEKSGRIYVTAYQWHGRWVAVDLGEMPTGADGAVQVEVAANFFAIVEPGVARGVMPTRKQQLRLFSPNKLRPSQWDTYTTEFFLGNEVTLTSGRNFVALLDKQAARLYRFTRDGDTWREDPSEQLTSNSVCAIAGETTLL
jgi:hypothetical protein